MAGRHQAINGEFLEPDESHRPPCLGTMEPDSLETFSTIHAFISSMVVNGAIHLRSNFSARNAVSSESVRLITKSSPGTSLCSSSTVEIQALSEYRSPSGRCWMMRKARSNRL